MKWTPENLVRLKDKQLNAKEIMSIENMEQRRVALEHHGYENFLKEFDAVLISESYDAQLYEIKGVDIEVMHLLLVQDASTERKYVLRTPPEIMDAMESKLWTFQKVWEWYKEGAKVNFEKET